MSGGNLSVDWSTAVEVGTILFAFGGFYWTTRNDMKTIREELSMLRKAVEQIAVQNARLDNHGATLASMAQRIAIQEQRIYDLSVGKGWVKETRIQLDGEYA